MVLFENVIFIMAQPITGFFAPVASPPRGRTRHGTPAARRLLQPRFQLSPPVVVRLFPPAAAAAACSPAVLRPPLLRLSTSRCPPLLHISSSRRRPVPSGSPAGRAAAPPPHGSSLGPLPVRYVSDQIPPFIFVVTKMDWI
jgi:hypothetical protein